MSRLLLRVFPLLAVLTAAAGFLGSIAAADGELAGQLRQLDATVVAKDTDRGKTLPQMLSTDARNRIRAANQRETAAWQQIKNKADWEKYRDVRIQALRDSLGQFPEVPKDLKLKVAKTFNGDGFKVENIAFETRPGLVVTANLYSPKDAPKSAPGFVIQSSHHNPKTEGELQDMGMTWARLGCYVIVPDSLGHGERRAHPFKDASTYPEAFKVGRQDYYFRYNTSLELYAVGESLIGWMAWDLSRCVDVLLTRPGIDKDRIILLGSVAGGGDPAGVAAALDKRIAAVAPFNFGGPQPETIFPLPADAESAFNYAGGGSWESTRNIRLSAHDGFMPWVIVGSVAPRGLIHAHEFAWDSERDPVWARYHKIMGFYDVKDRLAVVHGKGSVKGPGGPDNTHCNNIGPVHRKPMYPTLKKWFNIPEPEQEYQVRQKGVDLLCLTPEVEAALKPKQLFEVAGAVGAERAAAARKKLAALAPEARRQQLQKDWARLLGNIEPKAAATVLSKEAQKLGGVSVERILLEVEPSVVVPVVLLVPPGAAKSPVVVGFAQQGKQEFLKNRADEIADLLAAGSAVCLPDLRGTGETRPGDGRGKNSGATSVSASELMLGQTLVGSRLRDLRSVLRYLKTRNDVDAGKVALWGDSFAPVNPADRKLDVPLDAAKFPDLAEPLGGLLALLGTLYEPDVKAAYSNGGLVSYQSLLGSHFLYVPHDAVVPGALTTGDLADLAAVLAPRSIRMDGLVDGLNRRVASDLVAKTYDTAKDAFRSAGAADRLVLEDAKTKPAAWLTAQLKAK